MRLEGFLSLLGCIVMLVVLILLFTDLFSHAQLSTEAIRSQP